MANHWHVEWLKEGVTRWNRRRKRVTFKPDLSGINFFELPPSDFRSDPKTSRYFEKIDLTDADLRGVDMSRLKFRNASFVRAKVSRSNLSGSNFEHANFKHADLSHADLDGSYLTAAIFEQTVLHDVSLENAEVDEAVFIGVNISSSAQERLTGRNADFYVSREAYNDLKLTYRTVFDGTPKATPIARAVDETKTHKNAYEVFFGTTRSPVFERGALVGYSSKQAKETKYGVAQVIVPDGHRIGAIGRSLFRRLFNRKSNELRLDHIVTLDLKLFFHVLVDINERSGSVQRPTIFVHGYNTSFKDAVLSAAQFGHDLGIGQGIGLFSWPSKGDEVSYLADEASAELNKYALADFIEKFAQAFPAAGVSIVAHSMGCRCLLGAIEVLSGRNPAAAKSLHQVVLAAADVDARLMPYVGKHAIDHADRITSYVGKKDVALRLSGFLHQFPRVGFVPPPFVMDGLDTILVNDKDLGAWAHGYIGRSRAVLADVHALLKSNEPPQDRFSIRVHELAGKKLWKLAD